MAWCEECDTLVEEEDSGEEVESPRCGTMLTEQEREPIPWYFKFMLVASRGYQGVTWVIHQA
jgi:uncharacterized paraquat-inducible protein A